MNALTHFLTQGSVMPPSLGPAPQSMMRDPFNQNPSDVALFKITTEATNSLYVDGIFPILFVLYLDMPNVYVITAKLKFIYDMIFQKIFTTLTSLKNKNIN